MTAAARSDHRAAWCVGAFTGLTGSHLWSVGEAPSHQGEVSVWRERDEGAGGVGVLGGVYAMSLWASEAAEPLNIHSHLCWSKFQLHAQADRQACELSGDYVQKKKKSQSQLVHITEQSVLHPFITPTKHPLLYICQLLKLMFYSV